MAYLLFFETLPIIFTPTLAVDIFSDVFVWGFKCYVSMTKCSNTEYPSHQILITALGLCSD